MDSEFNQPIFHAEVPAGLDETWRHGALIGGMVGVDQDGGIARAYKRAADRLLDQAWRDDDMYEVILPVLFNYRQAIESRLKAVIRSTSAIAASPESRSNLLNHDLKTLLDAVEAKLGELPTNLRSRVMEFEAHDPKAQAFRFHASKPPRPRRARVGSSGGARAPRIDAGDLTHFAQEVWVDGLHAKRVVESLFARLDDMDRRSQQHP